MMCKGGVGKTTSAYFLAKKLSLLNKRILAIDSDPQGNMTTSANPSAFNFEINEKTPVLADVVAREIGWEDAILKLTPFFHLIPSTSMNSLTDRRLETFTDPVIELKKIFRSAMNKYDYIIFDSAPALNLVNAAIAYFSNLVILPVTLDEFSRQGLEQTLTEIEDLQNKFNFKNEVRILVNMFNDDKLSLLYLGLLAESQRKKVLSSTVRYSLQIKRFLSSNEDIFLYKNSKATEDYERLTREVLSLSEGLRRGRDANL